MPPLVHLQKKLSIRNN